MRADDEKCPNQGALAHEARVYENVDPAEERDMSATTRSSCKDCGLRLTGIEPETDGDHHIEA